MPRRGGAGKDADAAEPGGLGEYRGKRNFSRSPEPAATPRKSGARSKSLRFVIQEHHARRLHWDLRLEHAGVLASWALPRGLPEAPGDNRFAAHTEDHPLEYLDFAGEIPQGEYGAGSMRIWDAGVYECLKWEPRKIEVALHGDRVSGRYALFAIGRDGGESEWMIHRMDPPSDPGREPIPERIAPMLARSGRLPAPERGWAFEVKWDGVRALAFCEPGRVRLQSRNLKDITASYPELGRLARALGSHSAVLDGEIVALDAAGRPSFSALQQRMHVTSEAQVRRLSARVPATYMIFDLVWLEGHSTVSLPYTQRRELLAELALTGEHWQTPEYVTEGGAELLQATAQQGLEGVVAKRLDGTYEPGGRASSWIKIKSTARQEFVVGGWLPGRGRRDSTIGALLLGVHDEDGRLRYVGRVGTGFTDDELTRLQKLLAPLRQADSPFRSGERPPREAVFAQPRLVAEVQFSEWTPGGNIRQPSYKGLREDKDPGAVVREDPERAPARTEEQAEIVASGPDAPSAHVEGRTLRLSNLDKVLYPDTGFTKGELIDYYLAVAPAMLEHLRDRPVTVTRWPDGVEGKSFFQKQSPAHRPEWVQTATLPARGKPISYTLVQDRATLLWLANLASIELHAPLARMPDMARPTALVFDLDPGAPATVVECCRVALQLQGMFENLGLDSYVKTSGSKGLQVYVPLNAAVAFQDTKHFAHTVAELLESAQPELVVARMTKTARTGRVLIDWSQNDPNKTTVCVYSLRPGPLPSGSAPLEWDEVEAALRAGDGRRLRFQAPELVRRLQRHGDLFAPVLSTVQQLPAL